VHGTGICRENRSCGPALLYLSANIYPNNYPKTATTFQDPSCIFWYVLVMSDSLFCGRKPLSDFDYFWQITSHTYFRLTPWNRVLLEKLIGFQLVEKFPALYGTRKFITSFKSARHVSVSWATSIQSISTHRSSWRSILILSFHLRLGLQSGLFPSGFTTKYSLQHPILKHRQATFLPQFERPSFIPIRNNRQNYNSAWFNL
jgi:hypothetical protein